MQKVTVTVVLQQWWIRHETSHDFWQLPEEKDRRSSNLSVGLVSRERRNWRPVWNPRIRSTSSSLRCRWDDVSMDVDSEKIVYHRERRSIVHESGVLGRGSGKLGGEQNIYRSTGYK